MGFGGFSWKRALGITKAKQQLSRKIGIPLTKSGRQRKLGALLYPKEPVGKALTVLSFAMQGGSKMESDERTCPFCAETIKAAAHVCKHCGQYLPNSSSAPDSVLAPAPNPAASGQATSIPPQPKPKKKTGCLKIFLYVFAGIVVIGIINSIIRQVDPEYAKQQDERAAQRKREDDERTANRESERAAADQVRTEQEKIKRESEERWAIAVPKMQTDFVNAILKARGQFKSLNNEIQQERARGSRAAAIQSILGGYVVEKWTGTVDDVSTNSDGLGILSVVINDRPKIKIMTNNNAFSDIGDDTLVKKNSPVYDQMGELSRNDRVIFSGRLLPDSRDFIRETSLTMDGSMDEPAYIIRFSSVEKLKDGK